MTDGLYSYPEYQDSGVEWLGDIPAHWNIIPLRAITKVKNERDRPELPLLSVYREYGVILRDSRDDNHNPQGSKPETYKVVHPGDLVLNKMKTWQGSLGVSQHEGIVSPAYIVCELSDNVYGRFVHSLLRSKTYVGYYNRISFGVRVNQWDMRYEDFKQTPVLLPPPDEQAAIVRFLDAAESRIRRYIRAKQTLIKLLNEQKQAIIQQAVTRGLDPDAPMKASGVEWLGEIPAHWELRRVRTLVKTIEQGISPDSSSYLADENSWGVLKSGCANRGVFRETEHKRLPDGFSIDPDIVVHVGDVIISRASGSPALVGSTARVHNLNYNLILSDKTFRPVFQQPLLADFIVYSMNTRYYRVQVEQGISGAEGLANNLPVSELKDFCIVIPPLEEALEIVSYLNDELPVVEYLINETQNSIDLIREYRTRLIADVVTGKVDVRGMVFEMPEAFDESDLLDVDEEDGNLDDDELEDMTYEAD